jgi:peptidoglycan/LPS O-acetylase OafA/YrhL
MSLAKISTLGQSFNPHRNSLMFLRLGLAVLVIFAHSYELGGFGSDPLKSRYGFGYGELAVDGFFAISGFLITGSYLNSTSVKSYLWKRCLRIFPGFWACLCMTALILCPVLYFLQYGNLNTVHNLLSNSFIDYVKANFFLRVNQNGIEGLFQNHPAQGVINGSLWSLFPELLCYLGVIIFGKLGLLSKQQRKQVISIFFILLILYVTKDFILSYLQPTSLYGKVWYLTKLLGLFTYFMAGALLFLYKDIIPFSPLMGAGSLLIFILCIQLNLFEILGPILLPYVLFGLATILPLQTYDRFGDYSYGFYIYSYPIQQTIYFFAPHPPSIGAFFMMSLLITFPLAWLSWQLVEQPSLRLKKLFINPNI